MEHRGWNPCVPRAVDIVRAVSPSCATPSKGVARGTQPARETSQEQSSRAALSQRRPAPRAQSTRNEQKMHGGPRRVQGAGCVPGPS